MISIGAVYRGPELRGTYVNRQIMAAAKALSDSRGKLELGKAPLVNAVFVIPGSLGSAGFDGLQFGDYSKKSKAVVVQIAVPADITADVKLAKFLTDSLYGANAMAFDFFRQKSLVFPLAEADRLVGAIARSLNGEQN